MHIGNFPPVYHLVLEAFAFWIGFRLYLKLKKRDTLTFKQRVPVLLGGMLGAAIGSKTLYLLEDPSFFMQNLNNWQLLLAGKSLVGGILGGWILIEVAKRLVGVKSATGDSFVVPLIVAMVIGRIGCFLSGLSDHTYGQPTDLPWALDFGDGVRRHPTQIYEILFLVTLLLAFTQLVKQNLQQGELWKIFILAYLSFRFCVEFIKPVAHVYCGLDIEQVVTLGAYIYYAPYLISKLRAKTAQGAVQ